MFVSRICTWKTWLGLPRNDWPTIITPPVQIPNVISRSHGLQAATILLGVDARVSSVERYQRLKKGDRVKVWYADAHGPTEYVLNLTFASTVVGDVRTGQWVLKKHAKEKDDYNIYH